MAIWNSLRALPPVQKFKDRMTATAANNAPKGNRGAKTQEATKPREGSKTAQVVVMLQRKNGAALAERWKKWAGNGIPSGGSWPAR